MHTVVVVERSEAKVTNVHETADSTMLIVVPRILKGTIGTQAKLVSWPASHTRHGVRGAAMRSMCHCHSCTAVNAQSVLVDAHNLRDALTGTDMTALMDLKPRGLAHLDL